MLSSWGGEQPFREQEEFEDMTLGDRRVDLDGISQDGPRMVPGWCKDRARMLEGTTEDSRGQTAGGLGVPSWIAAGGQVGESERWGQKK